MGLCGLQEDDEDEEKLPDDGGDALPPWKQPGAKDPPRNDPPWDPGRQPGQGPGARGNVGGGGGDGWFGKWWDKGYQNASEMVSGYAQDAKAVVNGTVVDTGFRADDYTWRTPLSPPEIGQNGPSQGSEPGFLKKIELRADYNRLTDTSLSSIQTYGKAVKDYFCEDLLTSLPLRASAFSRAVREFEPSYTSGGFSYVRPTADERHEAMDEASDIPAITGGLSVGGGGGVGGRAGITKGIAGRQVTIQSGHGARHLAGTRLAPGTVESAIGSQVQQATSGASATGSFRGRVTLEGHVIEYRAFTLPNGTINVGTYYPVAP
jgi:hypothetical protein